MKGNIYVEHWHCTRFFSFIPYISNAVQSSVINVTMCECTHGNQLSTTSEATVLYINFIFIFLEPHALLGIARMLRPCFEIKGNDLIEQKKTEKHDFFFCWCFVVGERDLDLQKNQDET